MLNELLTAVVVFWAFLLMCNHQWRDRTYSNQNKHKGCGQSRRLCRWVVNRQSTHSWFAVLSSPRCWDCCLLTYSERGTVVWRSERVTACICVRSFDDAEQKGVQVSQTARHTEQVIQMSLCSCHSREMPLYRFKQNKYTENKGIIGFKHLVFLRNACRLNSHLQLTEGRKRLSL